MKNFQKLDERALADVSLKMTACESEVDLQHPLLVSLMKSSHDFEWS